MGDKMLQGVDHELRKMFVREDDRLQAAGVTGDGNPMRSWGSLTPIAAFQRCECTSNRKHQHQLHAYRLVRGL